MFISNEVEFSIEAWKGKKTDTNYHLFVIIHCIQYFDNEFFGNIFKMIINIIL